MEKEGGKKLAMVTVVSEVLRLKKVRKNATHEEIMRELEGFIHRIRNDEARLMMVVAASKTLEVIDKNPKMNDKEILRMLVNDFDSMIRKAGEF